DLVRGATVVIVVQASSLLSSYRRLPACLYAKAQLLAGWKPAVRNAWSRMVGDDRERGGFTPELEKKDPPSKSGLLAILFMLPLMLLLLAVAIIVFWRVV